ncbi:MAG: glycoside hydrolase family 85, partial [Herbinix sp.]|nr:glycoside hydrolase family 85 [Herbinix sp.]
DGKTNTKWCATGPAPHNIIVDLGEIKVVSEVYMAHAEKGNESPDMNTLWYTIETSVDGKIFEPAIEAKTNTAAETLDTFRPREARYVKVTAIKPTQGSDSAVRIYEVQVHGLNK